ncbi:MAG: hypothetical protein GY866_23400 [Proteobacteria bacterium]|nr:hypothetical protein [Pseudomonadota bacterium]
MEKSESSCNHPLDFLFHPKSVAIAGVSKNPENVGHRYLRQLLEFPFQGSIYPVSIVDKEVGGVKCYESVGAIPGPVDHVISCLPHHQVLSLVEDCVKKEVRSLHLFTARLGETQLEDRLALEKEIIDRARRGKVRIIGPNCMGLYCPTVGLTFRFSLPRELGHVAFVSQSGGNAANLEYQGVGRGLRFSKIISFGNASDLNESDFFDYLIDDPQTRVIALYLEGVKDGKRFVDLLRRANGKKPVVLFKAGRTQAGSRAVVSHTASLSGEEEMWEAVCRQFGVIRVHSIPEMADVLLAFQFLEPAKGKRALIMGGGGGGSVEAADVCELEGFEVPPLPSDMREEIRSFAPEVWSLISNPMDGSVMGGGETMVKAFRMGTQWDGVDVVLGNTSAIWLLDHPDGAVQHEFSLELLIGLAKKAGKPMVVYLNSGDTTTPWRVEAARKAQERCVKAGIPVYPNIIRAARALARFTGYFRRLQT